MRSTPPADFRDCKFRGDLRVNGASWDSVSFRGAAVHQQAVLRPLQAQRTTVGRCDFRDISFRKDGWLAFNRVDLSESLFSDTNLEHVALNNVGWARRDGRRALFEEAAAFTTEALEALAENYRQLVLNYESKRDYDAAEDFHIGEMETRRRLRVPSAPIRAGLRCLDLAARSASPHERLHRVLVAIRQTAGSGASWLNAYGVYSLLSRYGTSYWRATLAFGALVILFSVGAMLAGFETVAGFGSASRDVVEYDVLPAVGRVRVSLTRWLGDFRKAAVLCLSTVTLQRERAYVPIGDSGRLLLSAAALILAGQLALVLFAVRRRFKR